VPLAGETTPAVIGTLALPERLIRAAQMDVQRPAAFLVLPDVAIDRLVADREDLEAREPADDLLGMVLGWRPSSRAIAAGL
jgi:hypothetical protein